MIKRISIVQLAFILVSLIVAVSAFAFYLPDTGQTKCYQDISPYAEIPCAGRGQDGAYNINPKSYTNNSDGTVADNNTGLMWQQQDNGITYNWYEASGTYHASFNPGSESVCGSLALAAYWDWRLPSRKELITIVDYSIPAPGPTINPTFTNTGSSNYWSSSPDAHSPGGAGSPGGGGAWGVNFSDGYVNNTEWMGETYRVRCVRGEQQSPAYTDNGNDTVTDQQTGIVWQKEDDDVARTWGEALSYCEGLNLASQSDWRLPNIVELESIVDDTRESPAIDPVFTNTKAAPYCSSTSYTAYPNYSWFVIFGAGEAAYNDITKGDSCYVRCARGGQSGSLGKVSISKNGSGIGTVVSSPAGIDCGGFCSAYYPINSAVVLTATPSAGGSIFSGWGEDVDCTDGQVTMDANKNCTATFSTCAANIAMIGLSSYLTIADAYGAITSAAPVTIELIAYNTSEVLTFGDNKNIILHGGFDCSSTVQPFSFTVIAGPLTIAGGSVAIDSIAIL